MADRSNQSRARRDRWNGFRWNHLRWNDLRWNDLRDVTGVRPLARWTQSAFRRIAPYMPDRLVRAVVGAKTQLFGAPEVVDEPAWAAPSPLIVRAFDEAYYRSQVEFDDDVPPLRHYLETGWRLGADPSPLFDVSWYLEEYAADLPPDTEPFSDYLELGWIARRDPTSWFSTRWYLDRLLRAGEPEVNPLLHYLEIGHMRAATVNEEHARRLGGESRMTASVHRETFVEVFEPDGTSQSVPIATLTTTPHRLVTFDMWDTLVRRSRPADAAKLATARRMARLLGPAAPGAWALFEARVEREASIAEANDVEEYEAHQVLGDLLASLDVDLDEADADAVVSDLVAAEVRDESIGTERIEPAVNVMAAMQSMPDKQVGVLSDFYLGAEPLAEILQSNSIAVAASDISVSCEIGASKRLGTSFAFVRERAAVQPHEHLHVGDNRASDIDRALAAGASAALVEPPPATYPGPGSLTPGWFDGVPQLIRREAESMLVPSTHGHRDPLEIRRARAAGASMAVIAVGLVAAAIDAAIERDIPIVHYLSREGAFLAEVHRRVAPILCESEWPRPVHLEVSRRATFGPSVGTLDDASIQRISRQYPVQSIVGLITSLGLDPAELSSDLASLPVDPDLPVDVDGSTVVREFLDRPRVRSTLERQWSEQRDLLLRYLDDRELAERAVVVDIGWRGTIQDNLCLLRPGSDLHGVYLGLFPYHNPQPGNATKQAAAFDGNRREPFAFADPPAIIESPLTPSIPTVVGYHTVDGRVEPIRVDEPGRADHLVAALQASVLDVAPHVAERIVAFGATPELLRGGLATFVRKLYADPPSGLADIWFESGHDDTFGAANVTPYRKQRLPLSVITGGSSVRELDAARESRWVDGYLRWTQVDAIETLRGVIAEANA
ncbi:MAG: HAD family hydrolase [Ilumatobacter sp.]